MERDAGDRRPQEVIDAASPGETVTLDPGVQYTIEEPLVVTTPRVTLRGASLRLADDADEDLIEVGADGVRITDFTLDGNRRNQHGDRQSNGVLVTGASNVGIARGSIRGVSRHGLRIVDTTVGTSTAPDDVIHVERGPVSDVTVRDVRIDDPRRDGCSVEGPDVETAYVENVRTVGSSDRGSVEIKDGASDAVVTNCYAEDCVYGAAVQDHGEYPTANVRILANTAVGCETLVDAQTAHPPENVSIVGNTGRDLGGDGMGGPGGVHAHLIEGLVIANNALTGVDAHGIAVHDCEDAIVTGNVLREVAGSGIDVAASTGVTIGDNCVTGSTDPGIVCRGGEPGTSESLLTDNRCSGGIELRGDVDRYVVSGNLLGGPVTEDTDGTGRVAGNLD